jgi:hypothetical protein
VQHPADWGKGLVTPQEEARRAVLARRREYEERVREWEEARRLKKAAKKAVEA